VQILEPPPIPVVDIVTDSEDEIELLQTPLVRDVVPILISDDSYSDVEILGERSRVDMVWEQLRGTARKVKDKEKMGVSRERPKGKRGYFGFIDG
jgi:hypothetical protein